MKQSIIIEDREGLEVRWSEGSSNDGQIDNCSEEDRNKIAGNFKFSFAAGANAPQKILAKRNPT